jgi:type III secretion protein T
MLFLVTGGLLSMIGMLYESYQVWPIASMTPSMANANLVELALRALNDMLGLALKVAAPFLLLMLMLEIGLGLLSRFAPQLNAFFLAMPLKALILSLVMLLYGAGMSESIRALPITNFAGMLHALREVWHE